MSLVEKTPFAFVLLFLSLLPLGCIGNKDEVDPETQRRTEDLKQIYDIYFNYSKLNQRPPKQLADVAVRQYTAMRPDAIKALQAGEYIVVWGVSLDKNPAPVLAYEKNALQQGGAVLMADGTVKTMTADHVKAALKGRG